ncbi:GGDEF domain-containing protein [Fictibacillus barbaricus]|uniref:Diguanylate cyclase (GGDEF)-like protein n=1 Tax=Fictibacillus barbaricus TaxID=182136 RepID=A0ABU1TX97_9BACL|nr:GGDEF domain-containing protein [Fictibacillus barbaricus]MDR7071813.1 diguanylate cyclase (GGDEF)-like protein [Fictibacillus barbaricus]
MGNTRLPAHFNHGAWNRKILNFFWIIIIVSVCVEAINSILTERPFKEFLLYFIIVPTVLLSFVTLIAEWGYRKRSKFTDYIIIGAASLIAGILVGVHYEMNVMYSSLFFPMLISTIYFEKKKVWLAFSLSLFIYLALSTFHPIISQLNDTMDQLSMTCILLTSTLVCIGIMSRGYEIWEDLKKAQAEHQELMVKSTIMEKQVKTDALTGLYNHMAFYEYIDVLILQAETFQNPFHLAIIDIDNFKKINDTYGHGAGDLILKRIAHTIKENVSNDDFVARYGGEEFVVILNDVSEELAFTLLDSVRRAVEDVVHPEVAYERITISIGLQTFRSGMHKQAFFEGADYCLYAAKREGKNRVITKESIQPQPVEV